MTAQSGNTGGLTWAAAGGGGGGGGISFDGSTANGILTYKDSDEATVESNLTYDEQSQQLSLDGNISITRVFIGDNWTFDFTAGAQEDLWTCKDVSNNPTAHGLSVNDAISFTTSGGGSGNYSVNKLYYVLSVPSTTTATLSGTYNGSVVEGSSDSTNGWKAIKVGESVGTNWTFEFTGGAQEDLWTCRDGSNNATAHGLSVNDNILFTTNGGGANKYFTDKVYSVVETQSTSTVRLSKWPEGSVLESDNDSSGNWHAIKITNYSLILNNQIDLISTQEVKINSKISTANTAINLYAESGGITIAAGSNNKDIYIKSSPLRLQQISAPSTTTDKLYNTSGNLTWNGVKFSSSFTDTPNGLSGTGSLAQTYVTYNGGEIITDIIIDITGLTAGEVDSGGNQAEPKVLGVSSGSQKYITQITDGINGQIYKAEVISIEDKSTYNFDVFVMFSPVSSLALHDDASNGNNGSIGFLFGLSSSPKQIINNISSQTDTINNYLPFKYSKYDTTNTQWNDVAGMNSIETTTTSSSSSSKTLQITSSTDIQVGMRITGMGISGIALVDAINSNTLTLSTFQSISSDITVYFESYNSTLKDKYLYITTTSYGEQNSTMFTSGKCKIKLYGIPV